VAGHTYWSSPSNRRLPVVDLLFKEDCFPPRFLFPEITRSIWLIANASGSEERGHGPVSTNITFPGTFFFPALLWWTYLSLRMTRILCGFIDFGCSCCKTFKRSAEVGKDPCSCSCSSTPFTTGICLIISTRRTGFSTWMEI